MPHVFRGLFGLLSAVLLVNLSPAAELLVAPDDAPQYRLSNIRRENDNLGRPVLVVDYKLVKKGVARIYGVSIAGKTKDGELRISSRMPKEDSGQLRIGLGGILIAESNFEIYLVMSGGYKKKYIVSNAVRLGNPGPTTRGRAWTKQEKEAAERAKLYRTPPASIPAGMLAVTDETTLVPGMPVNAGHYTEWVDAEIIRLDDDGKVTMKYADEKTLQIHPREQWIAVDPDVLARAESNPEQFKTNVRVLPGSRLIIPDGANPIDEDLDLPEGTPLLYDYSHVWRDVYVVSANFGNITLRYKGYGSNWDTTQPRSKFLIKEETLRLLSKPETAEKFANNLTSSSKPGSSSWPGRGGSGIRHKSYPVSIPLPKGAQFVPEDLKIEKGTPLAACYARKWNPITALSENEDGSLYVRWDEYPEAFNCNMTRDQLIIEDKTIRKLRRMAKQSTDDLKKRLRTWTDSTGKHKIDAWYVSKTDTEVTLKTDSGRELTLPLEKLSDKDRELLNGAASEDDNPFKP